jgi:hypothetical protein
MNGVWSRPPLGRIASLSDLGDLGERVSEGAGESSFVCRLPSYPGWLYKAYRAPSSADNVNRLDGLIGLPEQMSAQDKSLVDGRTAWPAVRVVDPANRTTGVLLPVAPEAYKHEMALPGGRSRQKYLEVDVLALSEERQQQIGLPPQSLADRISVCASIAATAELLERHGLVYLDWSYANTFWRPADHSAYLIDLDGMSFGPRPQIQSPQWDDPHVPLGTTAGNRSDRYRVALLVTTCLTGKRVHDATARTELGELRKQSAEVEQLAELLIMALTQAASSRPTIARMKAALDAVGGASSAWWTGNQPGSRATGTLDRGGVTGWKPIYRGSTTAQTPVATPQAPPPTRPAYKSPVGSTAGSPPPRPGGRATSGTVRSGSTSSAAGTGTQQASRSSAPASVPPSIPVSQPSNPLAVAGKAALWIVAVAVVIIILANIF